MGISVNTAFNTFNSEVVNLLPDRSDKAKSSRGWLYTQLNSLQDKEDLNFPFRYELKHINYGSFQRKTQIRELDDIDLMFCFTANGATYAKSTFDNTYKINTPNAGQRLKDLSDLNVLNSRRVVNKVIDSLSGISQYKSATTHRRGEAATLDLISYEWVFDIVPCFYTDTDLYLIPDGNGNWKPTDPRVDQNRVTEANKNNKGQVLQLIRTLKYWNEINSTHKVSSYLFENIIINFVNSRVELSPYLDFNIRDFFYYLSSAILHVVKDPKQLQGDLNSYDSLKRLSISNKATDSYKKAQEAIHAEVAEKDNKKSINKWREVFGQKFPTYE